MLRVSFFFAAVVLLAGSAGLYYGLAPRAAPTVADLLGVPSEKLNFGTVYENEAFPWTLPITNEGPNPVEVESISASCGCMEFEPKSFTLQPGETVELRLTIDLLTERQANGSVALALYPQLKTAEGTPAPKHIVWRLNGVVKHSLNMERYLNVGVHSDLESRAELATVAIEAAEPLASLTAKCDLQGIEAAIRATDDQGKRFRLDLTMPTSGPARLLEGQVNLTPVSKQGKTLPPCVLRIVGRIVADAVAEPPELLMGGLSLGEAHEETITIRSLTNRPCSLSELSSVGDGLKAEQKSDRDIQIRQEARSIGTQTNIMKLVATVEGRRILVEIPVAYTRKKSAE